MNLNLGQVAVATAGPTMPASVAAANNIIATQPYYNLIVGIGQASVNGSSTQTITSTPSPASAAMQYQTLLSSSPSTAQAELQQMYALWQFLPTYLANASIIDAWDKSNNFGPGTWTVMGQATQAYLSSFFAAIGVTPPAQGDGSADSFPWIAVGIAGVALLLILLEG